MATTTSTRPTIDSRRPVDRGSLGTPSPVPSSELRPGRPHADAGESIPDRVDHLANSDLITSHAAGGLHRPSAGLIISVVSALLIAGLGLLAIGDESPTEITPALRTTGTLFWVAAAVVVLLSAVSGQFAELSARVAARLIGQDEESTQLFTGWILPAVVTLSSALLIATYHNWVAIACAAVLTFVSILVALWTRDLLDDLTDSGARIASLTHGAVVHLVAFVGLSMVMMNKPPEWLAAAAVAIISGLLILEILQRVPATDGIRLGHAAIGGLVMGQCAIAVSWWLTWNWTAGIALLVCFYLVAGLLLTQAQQRILRPPDVAFYAGLSAVALVVIAWIGT